MKACHLEWIAPGVFWNIIGEIKRIGRGSGDKVNVRVYDLEDNRIYFFKI